jgi:integrase/recombinase XerD
MTLSEQITIYLEHLRALNYSPRSIQEERYTLQRFASWLARTYQVDRAERLRKTMLDAWLQHLCGTLNAQGYPIKPKTINKHLSFTRSFVLYLAARGFVPKSLAEIIQRLKEPNTLPGSVLTHAQVRKLLRKVDTGTAEGMRTRAMLELLYTSGIRARELTGLDVADVDLEHGTALVHGKGRKDRVVPIGKTALRYLQSYVVAVRPSLLRDRSETALFLNAWGNRFAYHSLQLTIQNLRRVHGLDDDVTAHTFRRSCTTELIRSGANVYHVKELLGHATLRTLKPYTRLTILDLKKTHEKCHPRERDERR